MKRYIDITKSVSRVSKINAAIGYLPSAVELVEVNISGSTYMFLPADEKNVLLNVFSGRFISDVYIISASGVEPMEVLTCDVIGDLEECIRPGDSVLIKTGWNKYVSNKELYYDKFPTIGVDLAEWLVRRKINVLLMDTPLMANCTYTPEYNEIYGIFAKGSILLVNNITNLDVVDEGKFQLVAMPLKVSEEKVAPVRVMLIDKF